MDYCGFEQGPIRPPNEASSLLIRVTRNCPWNRCLFCPVYNEDSFSKRSVADVKRDIDSVLNIIGAMQQEEKNFDLTKIEDKKALSAAHHWFLNGMNSIFIQDANSLVIRPSDFVEILWHLKTSFPWVKKITSYARSHTVARISQDFLKKMREAGLTRIHIGLESGSDQVLKMMQKGVNKQTHIDAGLKIKEAGIELSEYIMPGLGGTLLSKDHAISTAEALNQIAPHFIRLRSLAIHPNTELYKLHLSGDFKKCSEVMVALEIKTLLEELQDIDTTITSDHFLNLFEEINGKWPERRENMLQTLNLFLNMDPNEQCLYQVGKRFGLFNNLSDLENSDKRELALNKCQRFHINHHNVDQILYELIKQLQF